MLDKKVADFTADATGGPFRLAAHKGTPVVLYFYPKDNTPGCTTESSQFRDAHAAFRKAGAIVVGCSRDSLKSHEGFKAKMELPFELISDADEKLCARCVTNEIQFYESHDLGTVWKKLRVEGVADFALSESKSVSVAVFVPERKARIFVPFSCTSSC